MIIRTQDECHSVALRNLERKQMSMESSSKSQSQHSVRSECLWLCRIDDDDDVVVSKIVCAVL